MNGARRSDRIDLVLPIEAIGRDLSGRTFCQTGRTSIISRHGAAIVLPCALATDQELTIRCCGTGKEAEARVVGPMGGRAKELIYGITFLDASVNPWDVDFPSLKTPSEGLARVLLQCRFCQAQEVVHLNEIEIQVFEANQAIHRFCKPCSSTTAWMSKAQIASQEALPKSDARPRAAAPTQPARSSDKRKHNRVPTNVSACVRRPGFPDEVVVCENLSRGGVRFRSAQRYVPGSRVELAIPYAPGTGNIFVSARIIHVQQLREGFRVGASYDPVEKKRRTQAYDGSRCVTERV